MTKLALFSDTHTMHKKVKLPKCDIAIFAGDMSYRGTQEEVEGFFDWFSSQDQCLNKIVIAGNHDLSFDPNKNIPKGFPVWIDELGIEFPEITYLENSYTTLFGLKIFGSPITPDFSPEKWAFNLPRGPKIANVWNAIESDTNIIITHGPAWSHHDMVNGHFVGCEDLRDRILDINPKLHVCGHIHPGYGIKEINKIIYANASVTNDRYNVVNSAIEVYL
jgi:3',5'-cyclic AMP phosphodiesterase CpdA